jgi:hypothetical protein
MTAECCFDLRVRNVEFDWLCSDADGFVGFFATAGAGPVPSSAVDLADAMDTAIHEMRKRPAATVAVDIRQLAPDISEWIAVAERGIFAFDWRIASAAYEVIARPKEAVRLVELVDPTLKRVASMTVLPASLSLITSLRCDGGQWLADHK